MFSVGCCRSCDLHTFFQALSHCLQLALPDDYHDLIQDNMTGKLYASILTIIRTVVVTTWDRVFSTMLDIV